MPLVARAARRTRRLRAAQPGPLWTDAHPADYGLQTYAWFSTHLKDPYSAQVVWVNPPTPAYCGTTGVPGWIVGVGVNAKNSYGGYIGARGYQFCFRDGALVYVSGP